MCSKIALICVLSINYFILTAAATQHHHHRRHNHNHSHPQDRTIENDDEIRRTGRFVCSEQLEDAQRLKNHWDQWELHCGCSDIVAPVCGSDGVTYHNRCHLECTSRNRYQRFSTEKLRLVTYSPCPDSDYVAIAPNGDGSVTQSPSRPRRTTTESDPYLYCLSKAGFAARTIGS